MFARIRLTCLSCHKIQTSRTFWYSIHFILLCLPVRYNCPIPEKDFPRHNSTPCCTTFRPHNIHTQNQQPLKHGPFAPHHTLLHPTRPRLFHPGSSSGFSPPRSALTPQPRLYYFDLASNSRLARRCGNAMWSLHYDNSDHRSRGHCIGGLRKEDGKVSN